jgi:hypothetical protein
MKKKSTLPTNAQKLRCDQYSEDCHFHIIIIIITTISSMYEFYAYILNFCDHCSAEFSFFYCSCFAQLFCLPRLDQFQGEFGLDHGVALLYT